MTLYTKENCSPCAMVKAYISTRPDLQDIIEIKTGEPQAYSLTYPTLLVSVNCSECYADRSFITDSRNIISFLKTLQVK
jgi:hypothetical protein